MGWGNFVVVESLGVGDTIAVVQTGLPASTITLNGADSARICICTRGDAPDEASGVLGNFKVWGVTVGPVPDQSDTDIYIDLHICKLLVTCAAPTVGTTYVDNALFGETKCFFCDDLGTVTVSTQAAALDDAFGRKDPSIVELVDGANGVAELLLSNIGMFQYLAFSLDTLEATPSVLDAKLLVSLGKS